MDAPESQSDQRQGQYQENHTHVDDLQQQQAMNEQNIVNEAMSSGESIAIEVEDTNRLEHQAEEDNELRDIQKSQDQLHYLQPSEFNPSDLNDENGIDPHDTAMHQSLPTQQQQQQHQQQQEEEQINNQILATSLYQQEVPIQPMDPLNNINTNPQQQQHHPSDNNLTSTAATSQQKIYLSPPPFPQPPQMSYYAMPDVPHPRPYSALISGSKTESVQELPNGTSADNQHIIEIAPASAIGELNDQSTNSVGLTDQIIEHPYKKQKPNYPIHTSNNALSTPGNKFPILMSDHSQGGETSSQQQQQQFHQQYPPASHQQLNHWSSQESQTGNWHKDNQPQHQQFLLGPGGSQTPISSVPTGIVGTPHQPTIPNGIPDYSQFSPLQAYPSPNPPLGTFISPNYTNNNPLHIPPAPTIDSKGNNMTESPSATTAVAARTATYSRKDKALGLLAQRLVNMYEERSAAYVYQQQQSPNQEALPGDSSGNTDGNIPCLKKNKEDERPSVLNTPLLSIDQTASQLLVERRRIYDIINILEALNVVTKKGKNVYWWHGLKVLENTFKELQTNAIYGEEFRKDAERNGMIIDPAEAERNHLGELDISTADSYFSLSIKKNPLEGSNTDDLNISSGYQRSKGNPTKFSFGSLGQLTKKFLSLYLIGYDALSLGEATERLLGFVDPVVDPTKLVDDYNSSSTHRKRETEIKGWKTKVRRLYDIANVLCSIGIIDKTSSPLSHKKCGNMLTSDGRAVHFHKNNQYFYWKFPKTPKQLFSELQNSTLSDAVIHPDINDVNGANPLCVNENAEPTELPQPPTSKELQVPLEDKSTEVESSLYEL